jgi:hypothetical protein
MQYHISLSPDALRADPSLPRVIHAAGVTDIRLTGFLYGYRPYPLEQTRQLAQKLQDAGFTIERTYHNYTDESIPEPIVEATHRAVIWAKKL